MGYGQCLYLASADTDKERETLERKFPLFDRPEETGAAEGNEEK